MGQRRPSFYQAALVSAWTSLVFLVIYNACNWITAQRPDVQTAAFAWERLIPVVDWMIVPYWSLDAFFVVAPFLCADKTELDVLRRRLVLTNVVAGLCFLILPLELAWQRPQVTGTFEGWFRAIQAMDAPHNLFPSMHIVLRTILAVHYARHSKGIWRVLSHLWFSLIGLSTLLTWQHHLVDVMGGFLLSAVIFRVVPDREVKALKNPWLGSLYLLVAGLLLVCCRFALPWSLVFAWPAATLGTVAAAYFGVGGAVLGKDEGQLPRLTRWLLAPWLYGQWLSWKYYRRQSAAWDKLTPRVWMGPQPDAAAALKLTEAGVTHVLDMTAEFEAPEIFRTLRNYLNIPVADLTAPTAEQLREAVDFMDRATRNGIVYVHCKAGYSRTAAAVGAWLLQSGGTAEAAILQMKAARPGMIVRPEVVQALRAFEKQRL